MAKPNDLWRNPALRLGAACAFVLLVSGGRGNAQPADVPQRPALSGYLGASGVPDERLFLPPPPADGSIVGRAELEIFSRTREQQGTGRWALAAQDAAADPKSMAEDFSCAIGVRLDLARTPAFARLMTRSMADAFDVIGPPKERYARPRPFRQAAGAVCVPVSDAFARSGAYPSGHAAVGWLYALILSQLAPDRSGRLLARGRSFGESRVICGVHYVSDVEAGRTAAAGLFAVLQSNAEFAADAAAARAELAQARRGGAAPEASRCTAEAAAERAPW